MAGTPGFGPPIPIDAKRGTPGFGPPVPINGAEPVADFSDVSSGGGSTEVGSGVTHTFGDRSVHPAAPPPGLVQTVGHGLQNGLMFGQQDRLDALLSPGDYSANLAKNQAATEAEQAAHPVASNVSNFVGGLASPANPVIGKALSVAATPIKAIAARFPALADRLAMRLTNLPSGDVAERVAQNFKNPAGAGKYAADTAELGLQKITPQATGEAAGQVMRDTGETLGNLRAGKSVPVEDVRNLVQTIGSGPGVQVPPEAARELQMLVSKLPQSGSVSLDELATLTQQHTNAPISMLSGIGSQASPEAARVLQAGKAGLEQLQSRAIGEAGQPTYQAAQKGYAISKGALEGTSQAMSHPTQSLTKAAVGGGGRTAAHAALKAYQVAKSPAVGAIARATAKAGPAAVSTLTQAAASGDSVQAGAALMQAQANDSGAREPEDDETKALREEMIKDED